MAELRVWLIKSPSLPPIKITIDDNISIFKLKDKLLAQCDPPAACQIICLRTGKILSNEAETISSSFRDDDSFMAREIPISAVSTIEKLSNLEKAEIPQTKENFQSERQLSTFSITGIPPYSLNFSSEYPVLAINIRYIPTGSVRIRPGLRGDGSSYYSSAEKTIYTKNTFFLVADQGEFRWTSQAESTLFTPEGAGLYPDNEYKQRTRYSLKENEKEPTNMIYPVRTFSITGISMDGFDPKKAYPVLAIDMDQFFPENHEKEENVAQEPQSQTMAFFLVGDDNGEFAWIAEDECRLFPLDS
jgi:hypothetical protein